MCVLYFGLFKSFVKLRLSKILVLNKVLTFRNHKQNSERIDEIVQLQVGSRIVFVGLHFYSRMFLLLYKILLIEFLRKAPQVSPVLRVTHPEAPSRV